MDKKWGIGTAIALVSVVIAYAAWQHPMNPPASLPQAQVSPSQPKPATAILLLKRGKVQVVSKKPLVARTDFTFRNVGDSIARDEVLSCGILQTEMESSHGPVPPVEPHGEVTVHVYFAEIADDVLHNNDSYCFGEPILSYTDGAGRHRVSFDQRTGQSSETSSSPFAKEN